jgi:hypothetical protein
MGTSEDTVLTLGVVLNGGALQLAGTAISTSTSVPKGNCCGIRSGVLKWPAKKTESRVWVQSQAESLGCELPQGTRASLYGHRTRDTTY